MPKLILCIFLVLTVIFIVPFIIYGVSSVLFGLKPPEGASPATFLFSVLVSKIGVAVAFVFIFYFARNSSLSHWPLYASIWWVMFVVGEVGQAIGPNYSWTEAFAGVVSETIYLPISAYITSWLIKA